MIDYKIDNLVLNIVENRNEMRNIFSNLLDGEKCTISFVNPEIFLAQKKDANLNNYFSNTKYNFIDGVGLLYAINRGAKTNYTIDYRYPGTDFFTYLPDRKIKVFLFGASEENVTLAKEKIEDKYNNIEIVGIHDGFTYGTDSQLINTINNSKPDILIVCLGCPRQELWIKENLPLLNVKIVFGNGGAIDFWSEKVKRAPSFLIKIGFEWFYRLLSDFTLKRIKRQIKLIGFYVNYKRKKYCIKLLK